MSAASCRTCGQTYTLTDPAGPFGGLCADCRGAETVTPTVSAPATFVSPIPRGEFPSLPGYEVLGELGRGGMGVVYKARHLGLGRLVALKVILVGAHAGADERARFRTEAETVARLQHPNVLQVYEQGEWAVPGVNATTPFLSLEFCGGGSLDRRLKAGPLAPHLAAQLIEVLARAIHHAHERRIVHRDLKPANILFTEAGVPKIADFGMARKLDEQGHTKSGTVMGTPSYMAPEQAAGKSKESGPAADVWALGAILHDCVTGRPPFRRETSLETIMAVINDPLPDMGPAVPEGLQAIIRRCLMKNPAERYPSAQALADDLNRWLNGRRTEATIEIKGGAKRRPVREWLLAMAATVGVVLALVTAVAYWPRGDREKPDDGPKKFEPAFRLPDKVGEVIKLDAPAPVNSVAFSRDGRHVAAVGGGDRREFIEGKHVPPDKRGFVRVWDLERPEAPRQLQGHEGSVTSAAFGRDEGRLLTAGQDGTARVWEVLALKEVARHGQPRGKPIDQALWLDGDRTIVTRTSDGNLLHGKADPDTLREQLTFVGRDLTLYDVAARPGAKQVAVAFSAGPVGNLLLGDVLADKQLRAFAPRVLPPGEVHSPISCAFSGDGTLLVSGEKDGRVRLWNADTGKLIFTFEGHGKAVVAVACSADGNRAVIAEERGTIRLLDLERHTEDWSARHEGLTSLAFSPDGRHVATAGTDRTVRVWGLPPRKR